MLHCHVWREYSVVVPSVLVFSPSAVRTFSSSSDAVGVLCLDLSVSTIRSFGYGVDLYVYLFLFGVGGSRVCQKQIQLTQISIRSFAYWLFQASCQRCLPRRCVWRVTTYDQWPYVLHKHSVTVQHILVSDLAPLKACLTSIHVFAPCVNWTDKNAHCVHRAAKPVQPEMS